MLFLKYFFKCILLLLVANAFAQRSLFENALMEAKLIYNLVHILPSMYIKT